MSQDFFLAVSASQSSNVCSCWCPHLHNVCFQKNLSQILAIKTSTHWLAWSLTCTTDEETITYICMTWTTSRKTCEKEVMEIFVLNEAKNNGAEIYISCKRGPVMVPCTMVPFFSSMETVSLLSFIRNLEHIHRKNPSSAAKPLPVFNPPHIFPGRSKNPRLDKKRAEISRMRSRHFCRWIPIVS